MAPGKAKEKRKREKKRNKLSGKSQSPRGRLLERVRKSEDLSVREIRINPPDQVKMSEVLLEFAAPLLESFDADIPARRIIGIATTAWNLSLLPATRRDEFLAEMARELSLETQDIKEMKKVMKWLVARKNKHFADHRRFVVDFEVSEQGNRRRLYVVSSPDLAEDLPKQG